MSSLSKRQSRIGMDYETAKQALLPLFTSKVLRELLVFGDSDRVIRARRTLESDGLIRRCSPMSHLFDSAYAVLADDFPAEYVLLNECLCSQVPGRIAVASYREQAVAGIKADLSIFWPDGQSRGYEVKSRFDRLDRLQIQLQTYQQVFSRTYVVADQKHVSVVLQSSPSSVGVLSFSRDGMQEIRPATERPDLIRPERLFGLLRKAEYLQLVRDRFGMTPRLPNTQIYQACFSLFRQIDAARAQDLVTEHLRQRQCRPVPVEDRAWRLPRSLRALTLTGNLDQSELLRLSYVLDR